MARHVAGRSFDPASWTCSATTPSKCSDGLDEAASWEPSSPPTRPVAPGRRHRTGRRPGGDGRPGRPEVALPGRAFARGGQPRGGRGAASRPAGDEVTDAPARRPASTTWAGWACRTRSGTSAGPLTDGRARTGPAAPLSHRPHAGASAGARTAAARSRRATTNGWTARGTPGALDGASLTPSDRLLAAADVYHAMTEPRPHRSAARPAPRPPATAREARAGDSTAMRSARSSSAAGHRAPDRARLAGRAHRARGGGARLLARGRANKQIATRLGVTAEDRSPTTWSTSTSSSACPAEPQPPCSPLSTGWSAATRPSSWSDQLADLSPGVSRASPGTGLEPRQRTRAGRQRRRRRSSVASARTGRSSRSRPARGRRRRRRRAPAHGRCPATRRS